MDEFGSCVLTHPASCHGARLRGCLQVKQRTRLVCGSRALSKWEARRAIHAQTACLHRRRKTGLT